MRIPEFLFPLINRVMRVLLNSPLHGVMSASVLLAYFQGRRSGRARCTPLRYLREGEREVVCLTARHTGWWPNFLGGADVALQLAGRRVRARAEAHPDDAERKLAALRRTMQRFPGDAPYHGLVRRRRDQSDESFEAAMRTASADEVVVVFTLL